VADALIFEAGWRDKRLECFPDDSEKTIRDIFHFNDLSSCVCFYGLTIFRSTQMMSLFSTNGPF